MSVRLHRDRTGKAQEALFAAQAQAQRRNHPEVDAEHILLALLDQDEGLVPEILSRVGANPAHIRQHIDVALAEKPRVSGASQVYISARAQQVLTKAEDEARRFKDEFISTEHLLLGLLDLKDGAVARVFKTFGVERARVLEVLKKMRGSQRVTDQAAEDRYQPLEKFGRDLTAAINGLLIFGGRF